MDLKWIQDILFFWVFAATVGMLVNGGSDRWQKESEQKWFWYAQSVEIEIIQQLKIKKSNQKEWK